MTGTKGNRVAVLGAGLSGLAAAERLGSQGHHVTILETQARVGGRAFSIREGLADGLIAETGPSRYPPSLTRIFELARKFGLTVESFYPESGTVVGFFGGRRMERYEPSPEEFWGYASIRNKYPQILERSVIRLALWARRRFRRFRGKEPWATYRIKGGTHQLAEALALASNAEIRLNSQVQSVVQDGEGVTITFRSSKGVETLRSDHVICAVPLSMLKTIDFLPSLSRQRSELAVAVPFSSAIRIFVQMDRPYWRDHGHNGFAVTDTIGEVWDPHFDAPRSPALLVCYAKDELAVELGALSEAERITRAVAELERIFPGASKHFEAGTSFFWDEQPWIQGGWPYARKGFSKDMAVFRQPQDRICFAGDYAAPPTWLNTAEGAVESGQHAADLVCRKLVSS